MSLPTHIQLHIFSNMGVLGNINTREYPDEMLKQAFDFIINFRLKDRLEFEIDYYESEKH